VAHDDAATAVVAALGLPAGVYNVADDELLRRRELFDSLATTLGVAPPRCPPTRMTPLIGSLGATLARSERITYRKLREASGWRPHYPSAREGWPEVVAALPVAS
jgi:2-alkyl-3-oxoalkanoate reductase